MARSRKNPKSDALPTLAGDDPLAEVIGELDASGLSIPELKFAIAVLAGETQTDAFRISHPQHASWARQSCAVGGHQLAKRAHVRAYLDEARRVGAQLGARNVDAYVSEVGRMRQIAVDEKQMSAAARLIETEGKALGHLSTLPQRDSAPDLQPNELVATMRVRLGDEAARRTALRLGLLDLDPTEGEAT